MLDIGWTELLVIAVVLIVVVGPKDLPPMLRAFGKMTANFRKMAGDFRAQFDEALRETEMDDVRKTISEAQRLNPTNALRDAMNPLRQMGEDIKADLQKATKAPAGLTGNATDLAPVDSEAQQAVEGSEPASIEPEVPPSVEPAAASPTAPNASAAPVTTSATTAVPASGAASSASAAPAVTPAPAVTAEPASGAKSPAKSRTPRKASVGEPVDAAAAENPPAIKRAAKAATSKAAASKATVEKSAAAKSAAAETATAKPSARKRATKKTETPKDEA